MDHLSLIRVECEPILREPSLKGDETGLEIVDERHGSLLRERNVQLRVIGVLLLVHVMSVGDTCNREHVPGEEYRTQDRSLILNYGIAFYC